MSDWPDRLNRFIDALQEGRRPERHLARTADELEELRLAARLAGLRANAVDPDPAFLADLRTRLQLTPRRRPFHLSRGGLLRAAGLWVAGVASGLGIEWGVRQVQPRVVQTGAPTPDARVAGGNWYPVGPLASLPVGTVRPFDAGQVPTFVVREDKQVRALSRICTHVGYGCLLRFDAAQRGFVCPCHGAIFDLDGKLVPDYYSLTLPPLPSIDVRVVDGTVYVLGA